MFEFTIENENKSRRLSDSDAENVAKDIAEKFERFDDLRARQKNVYKLLKKEIYLEDRRNKKKAAWKSQIFLNKIYSYFQTRQAFIWDNVYSSVDQMFDVEGRDEISEKTAKIQKAALVNSFDKMKVTKQLDPAIEHLDVIGEACLFVSWKRKIKRIRRRMSLAEQLQNNGLLSLIRGRPEDAYGYFEQVIYEGAYVEAINPLNLVFDPAINPDNDEEWDKGLKIIKSFETYDAIVNNKLYQLSRNEKERLKEMIAKNGLGDVDSDKDSEARLDEIINGRQIEVLHVYGDYNLPDGTLLRNWSAAVIGRQFLARFEENQFVINPIINAATQRDPEAAQIDGASKEHAMALADEYSQDGVHQFAEAVDQEIGKLYPVAGIYKEGADGAAIVLTKDNVGNMMSVMKAEFQRAKAWKSGKMGAFLPPEISALLNQVPGLLNTETGMKQREAGFVGKLAGWKIYESNNIATDSDGNVYPLFGVLGETTASVKQRKINLIPYMREKSLNKAFKGAGVYGTGCPRPDKFGTIKAKVTLSI